VAFVVDASVVGNWHFADERRADVDRVLDATEHEHLLVAAHWWFEIRNVLLIGERRGRASQRQTEDFLVRLSRLPIDVDTMPSESDVFSFARRHRLTFYDAAYLELAWRSETALATTDYDLAKAAKAEGVSLVLATE
jgi:predicted nucleic acid-binding protein